MRAGQQGPVGEAGQGRDEVQRGQEVEGRLQAVLAQDHRGGAGQEHDYDGAQAGGDAVGERELGAEVVGQDGEGGGEEEGLAGGEHEAVREEVEGQARDEGGGEERGGGEEAPEQADEARVEVGDEEGAEEAEDELDAVGDGAYPCWQKRGWLGLRKNGTGQREG